MARYKGQRKDRGRAPCYFPGAPCDSQDGDMRQVQECCIATSTNERTSKSPRTSEKRVVSPHAPLSLFIVQLRRGLLVTAPPNSLTALKVTLHQLFVEVHPAHMGRNGRFIRFVDVITLWCAASWSILARVPLSLRLRAWVVTLVSIASMFIFHSQFATNVSRTVLSNNSSIACWVLVAGLREFVAMNSFDRNPGEEIARRL